MTRPGRPRPSSRPVAEALGVPVAERHPDYGHHPTMTGLCGFVPLPGMGEADLGVLPPGQPLEPRRRQPDAFGRYQVAASQSPAGPRAMQPHMVPDDLVPDLFGALVRATLIGRPARGAEVGSGQIHAKTSTLSGEGFRRRKTWASHVFRHPPRYRRPENISHNAQFGPASKPPVAA